MNTNIAIETQWVTLPVEDGTQMRAYVARPSQPGPGLLVFQEAFGVNGHIRDITERFARQGFTAIAPELYHRTAPGFEAGYTDFPLVREHMAAITLEGMEADQKSSFHWLEENAPGAPISCIGFCLGGRASFLAATHLDLACGISFYGGGIAPNVVGPGLLDRTGDVKCPLLLFWGGKDQHITEQHYRAIEDVLKQKEKEYVQVVISDADHGFFCDARASYSPKAAAQASALTLEFLRQHTLV